MVLKKSNTHFWYITVSIEKSSTLFLYYNNNLRFSFFWKKSNNCPKKIVNSFSWNPNGSFRVSGDGRKSFIFKFSNTHHWQVFWFWGFKYPELVVVTNRSNTRPTLVVSPDVPKDIHPWMNLTPCILTTQTSTPSIGNPSLVALYYKPIYFHLPVPMYVPISTIVK